MTQEPTPTAIGYPLTTTQTVGALVIGATLWLFAALLCQFLGPMGVFNGWAGVALYVILIPATVPFVYMVRILLKLRPGTLTLAYSLATALALLLDGTATRLIPWLYGEYVSESASVILWGAGVGIFLAAVIEQWREA